MSAATLRAVGFRAELNGASLWDLVQMECQARSRLVVQVKGEGGAGFLYFAEGRVVHAVTARATGEAAALEILAWTNGSFQPCDRAWPGAPTIDTPCDGLILQAAQRRDEEETSNLVAFPVRADVDADADVEVDVEIEDVVDADADADADAEQEREQVQQLAEKGITHMRSPNIEPPSLAAPLARTELTAEFPVVLRLGAGGALLKNKGASEEMAGVVAYAHRLVQLAGELLGLEEIVAMECQFTEGRCLIFTEDNGDLVALRPRADANLHQIRERLGL